MTQQKDYSINNLRAGRKLAAFLLLLLFIPLSALSQTTITSLDDITDPNGSYILSSSFSTTGTAIDANDDQAIGTSTKPFTGTIDGGLTPITGTWDKPLFDFIDGATIKNVIIENTSVSTNGITGSIAGTARGASRIYNCGILSGYVQSTGGQTDDPKTANCCGGIIGLLEGTSRVINCYSYADITGGNRIAGIVGYNNGITDSDGITTMVMNCMFYGDIKGGYRVSPIYGGNMINNLQDKKGLNTFNFYAYDKLKSATILASSSASFYNCALAVEERYLTRFEFYRLLLNSNKKLAAWYITGSVGDADILAKWVLETADRTINDPKPYPVLKQQGFHPSIINPDFANAPDSASVGRNKGGKLGKTLNITISTSKTSGGQAWPSGASITTTTDVLVRTDMDSDRFNFNYDKVQLPYYNDYGTGNYTEGKVVTGWKIVGFTGGTAGTYKAADEWNGYNFADRNCTNKDLYGTNGSNRVFSQGAYFDVPYGVTGITIEPYWGFAAFIADQNYDVVYTSGYGSKTGRTAKQVESATVFNGVSVKTDINTALGTISSPGSTVYDNAIVLVGNFHQNNIDGKEPFKSGTTPFTLMSVDLDNDHEPDYSLIYHDNKRSRVPGIRFDFLNIIGTAQAQKPNSTATVLNASVFNASSWFEITNTALIYFSQFEYENSGKTAPAPIILLGGVFDQFTSTKVNQVQNTTYIHVGSNAWFKEFSNGTHSDGNKSTKHIPISATGGEYNGFYLTGTYNASAAVRTDNAECYVSGGHFVEAAGAGQEQINGNVQWQIYNAYIDNFFGGGINSNKPIKGDITIDIYNSHVGTFCGGPKFGDMQSQKKVTTNATGCTFGRFFGAGFGGTAYARVKYFDESSSDFSTWQTSYTTTDKGIYYNGTSTNASSSHADYGKKGLGVATDFDYEFFVWTSGTTGGRFFVKFASFSLAQCNDVESTLNSCTINGNFYGGGSLGKVTGKATSVLNGCTVNGNVFGGGYSATIPDIPVRNDGFNTVPTYNRYSGMFEPGTVSGTTTFNWKNATEAGITLTNGGSGSDANYIFTDADLTALGQVQETDLKITGNTYVQGGVFGGGDQSLTYGSTKVTIENPDGQQTISNVYGGGNEAGVTGSTNVILTSGSVTGGVYGGCNASGSVGPVTVALNGGTASSVYGGGFGSATTTTGDIGVTLNGTTVNGDIYGGSALGGVNASTSNTTTVTLNTATLHGSVFGGGMGDNNTTPNPTTAISNGNAIVNINVANTYLTGIYGGANINGLVKGNIDVNVNANVGTTGAGNALDIFGGGYGANTNTEGNITVTIGSLDGTYTPTIYGDIYGGSALGNVNDAATDLTKVDFLNGTLHGNIYGGCLGQVTPTPIAAKVNGQVQVNIGASNQSNCAIDLSNASIFGCNNTNGSPQDNVTVNIYCTAHNTQYGIDQVFGGGNRADYAPQNGLVTSTKKATVNVIGCLNTIRRVFAGGNAAAALGVATVIDGGQFDYVFGGGNGETLPADIGAGGTNLIVHGGNINNLFGGSNTSGTISGTMSTTIDHDGPCQDQGSMYIAEFFCGNNLASIGTQENPVDINAVIGCGTRFGDVYGGCNQAVIYGNVQLTIEGGVIDTVYAGSKGSTNDAANINGDVTLNIYGGTIGAAFGGSNINGNITGAIQVNMDWSQGPGSNECSDGKSINYVYGGSNLAPYTPTAPGNYPEVNILHGTVNHSVYGGGRGASAIVSSYPVVTIGDTVSAHYAVVTENVYGGGDAAPVVGKTKVIYNETNSNGHVANVFGGGNAAGVSDSSTVILKAGNVTTGVYGGCNTSGIVTGAIAVFIDGGTVGTDATNTANVHGGGYGASTGTGNNVTVTVGNGTSNPIIWGDVYGGSALGNVNAGAAQLTKVWLKSGTINGSLYGGGLGDATHEALVNGAVQVIVDGGAVDTTSNSGRTTGAVFGCNNVNGTPKSTVEVIINSTAPTTVNNNVKTYALQGVYGGGNLAHYDPTTPDNYPTVTINGCGTSIKDVYGGGNAAAVPYTCVTVNNGDIDRVFAGGNGESGTPAHIGYKNTDSNPTSGNYGAGTTSAIILGGTINQVFGGSNANGIIRNGIVVDVDWADDNTCNDNYLGSVFGGGNLAPYGTADASYPQVNILNARIANNVFGGGLGPTAIVTGNPQVTIGSTTNGKKVIITGDVYGGGDAAQVNGTPVVTVVSNVNDTIGYVYGGGNAADVTATDVTINGGNIGMVFGGGHGDKNSQPQKEANVSDDVTLNITGGTIGKIFGGSNSKGSIGGDINLTVDKGDYSDPMHIGEVYGGGNEAAGNAGTISIVCTGGDTEGIDDVYGGANQADISNDIELLITGGRIQRVFGGNNTSGSISGDITVTVDWDSNCANSYLGSVFGGGNMAAYSGTPTVNIENGIVSLNVYGGGNEANVGGTVVNMNGGTVLTGIYGGCNTSGTVTGLADVNINGGTVGANNSPANIHGGGYGPATLTTGNVEVTVGTAVGAQTYPTIYGDVYGGSALGKVNGTSLDNSLHTYVILNAGIVNGSMYGGALGNDTTAANVYAPVTVTVNGGTVTNDIYGCNNINGAPQGSVTVDINGTDQPATDYAIAHVFGGGNRAAYDGTPVVKVHNHLNKIGYIYGGGNQATVTGTDVTVYGGTDIGYVFGGGYGASVTQSGTKVYIHGGTIQKVFGGNDQSGIVNGDISVTIDRQTEQGHASSALNIGEVYGGGNVAASQAGILTIRSTGTDQEGIGYVFGGANDADVNGNITLNITGGRISNLFGGNNTGHTVNGDIEVNVNWHDQANANDAQYLNNVYGGGQKADVSGNAVVNIINGTVDNDVYGGGMEGHISGNVTVNIGTDTTLVLIKHDVYGGGALANTNTANIKNNSIDIKSDTCKKTIVNLYPGATINHDVYGGGLGRKATAQDTAIAATVYGNVTVTQFGAALTASYDTLGLAVSGRIFGCNNVNGTPKGHVLVNIKKTARNSNPDYDLAAVYGGGNEAEYLPFYAAIDSSDYAEVIISPDDCDDISIHSVYGGGNAASTPATMVTIRGAYEIMYVFGGGNGAGPGNPGANVGYHDYSDSQFTGTTQDDIAGRRASFAYGTGVATTNIYGGSIHYVYGGSNTKGNIRQTAVAMLDELSTCELVLDGIYGGGREAYMEGTTALDLGCLTGMQEIYGGSEKADVGGNVELTITSGHYDKVFGGNNKGGRILGSITVNIEQTGCVPITIDELYLGGNNAPYSVYGYDTTSYLVDLDGDTVIHYVLNESGDRLYDDPQLNIRSFESINKVFGGGNGELATMVGNPKVDINITNGWVNGEYTGGQSQYSKYVGTPQRLQKDGVIDTIYGGGNSALVIGDPYIFIGNRLGLNTQLKSMNALYESVGENGKTKYHIKAERAILQAAQAIKYTNLDDNTKTVTVPKAPMVNGATITGNVYGGGNNADVTGNTHIQLGPKP